MSEAKECSLCRTVKPTSEFNRDRQRSDGLRPQCRSCHNAVKRDTYVYDDKLKARLQKHVKNGNKYYWHLRRYGIGEAEYLTMLVLQDCFCGICGRDFAEYHGRLCVDHDHSTGVVRGLLCLNCNAGIGQLQDDVAIVEQAVTYLKERANGWQ
jgi:hypothetical protein